MKKIFSVMIAAVVLLATITAFTVSAATEKVFSDNFSNGLSKWTHANNDEIEENDDKALDPDRSYKVENGQLRIDAAYDSNSFLYLTAEGVKAAEFTITWKMKSNITGDSWVGVSVLKDSKDRFNGCNNALAYFRFSDSGAAFQLGRGYPGGGGVVDQTPKAVGPGLKAINVKEFHTYQVEYKAGTFKAYIDNDLISTIAYNKLKNPGYISLNACIADVVIDDFKIVYTETATSADTSSIPKNSSSAAQSSKPASNQSGKPASNQSSTVDSQADSSDVQSTDTTVSSEVESFIGDTSTTESTVEVSSESDSSEVSQADQDNPEDNSNMGPIVALIVIGVIAVVCVVLYFTVVKAKGGFKNLLKK